MREQFVNKKGPCCHLASKFIYGCEHARARVTQQLTPDFTLNAPSLFIPHVPLAPKGTQAESGY